MVGLFINTVPVRVRLPPGEPLRGLLTAAPGQPVATAGPPAPGAGRDPAPGRAGRAVRHLTVFENYPLDPAAPGADAGGLRVTGIDGPRRHPLPAEPAGGARRAAAAAARLPRRPVRPRERRGHRAARLVRLLGRRGAPSPSAPLGRLDMLSADERQHRPGRLERHRRAYVPRATLPELFAPQAARTPGRRRAGLRRRDADLRRARRARQPAGAPPARAGVGPETRRGAAARALGRPGGRAARVCSRPAAPTCRSTRTTRAERLAFMLADAAAPVLVTHGGAAHPPCRPTRPASSTSTPTRPGIAPQPADAPARPHRPGTPRTSSTPRAPPARPRASSSRSAASPITCAGWRTTIRSTGSDVVLSSHSPSASTRRSGRSGCRSVTGAALVHRADATQPRPRQLAALDRASSGVTVAHLVPSLLEPVMAADCRRSRRSAAVLRRRGAADEPRPRGARVARRRRWSTSTGPPRPPFRSRPCSRRLRRLPDHRPPDRPPIWNTRVYVLDPACGRCRRRGRRAVRGGRRVWRAATWAVRA